MLFEVESFAAIDARRIEALITIEALCAEAGVSLRTWWRLRKQPDSAQDRTLRRLSLALGRLIERKAAKSRAIERASAMAGPVNPAAAGEAGQVETVLRMATSVLAVQAGADPLAVLATDFTVQKPLNPGWLEASQLRRAAMWLLIVVLGLSRAAVAAAAGCSRQNIKQALDACERRQETDPDFAALLAGAARLIGGEA